MCPECHTELWVDIEKKIVVQHKKSEKRTHSSFDDLLVKEKEKKEKADERFLQAKELEQAKKKKAEELFKKSFSS